MRRFLFGRTPIKQAAALVLMLVAMSWCAGSAEAKRVAFVVGINSYDSLGPDQQLRKAINDARAVADTLKDVGFQVFYAQDTRRADFLRMWQNFLNAVQKGDTAAFYFAGHGFEMNGSNYLLLRDVPELSDGEEVVKSSSIQVSAILDRLSEQQPQVSLFIIDACRDDPFKRRYATRSTGVSRGLARVEPPSGTLVMMSAGAGQEALDSLSSSDPDKNSVYTRTLLPLLKQPNLEIVELAKQVRSKVADLAARVHHDQRPAFNDELSGDFYLSKADAPAEVSRSLETASGTPNEAFEAWAAIKTSTNISLLDAYSTRFSDSFYAKIARARIDELKTAGSVPLKETHAPAEDDLDTVWAATKNTTSVAVLRAFLRQHGDSVYADDARARLTRLTQTAALTPFAPRTLSVAPLDKPGGGRAEPLKATDEARLKAQDTFRECPHCPEMVVVPTGSFTMGSPPDEPGRQSNEGPQHLVDIATPVAVGRFAVTSEEWAECVAKGGCLAPPSVHDAGGSYPIVEVSFEDATAYVTWLSAATGKRYRLLSEAEREYVARAGSVTAFWWGSSITTRQANYGYAVDGTGSQSRGKPLPVGFFQANAWGLYQVHGNVSEWVADCYHPDYSNSPRDGRAWIDPGCARRVVRGGSWYDDALRLRAASRMGYVPGFRDSSIGFRVARAIDARP